MGTRVTRDQGHAFLSRPLRILEISSYMGTSLRRNRPPPRTLPEGYALEPRVGAVSHELGIPVLRNLPAPWPLDAISEHTRICPVVCYVKPQVCA